MSDPRLRMVKIKIGVVKRLTKEKLTYEKEAEHQKTRVQTYKDQGKDIHDIKKQEEVLQESLMMVPDCQRRLLKAYEDLKSFLENDQDFKELKDSKEIITDAEKVLEDAENHLPEKSV